MSWWILADDHGALDTTPVVPSTQSSSEAFANSRQVFSMQGPRDLLPAPLATNVDVIPVATNRSNNARPASHPGDAAPASIEVLVVDGRRNPVVDASIAAVSLETGDVIEQIGLTDEHGRAHVELPRRGYGLEARKPDVGTSAFYPADRLRDLENESCTLKLMPALRFEGVVVHPDGAPAVGALVYFESPQATLRGRIPPTTTTELNGTFTAHITPWATIAVSAELDGLVTPVVVIENENQVMLRLPGRWSVGGLVVDESNEPVAGAEVTIWRSVAGVDVERDGVPTLLEPHRIDTFTDEDGSFAVNVPTLSEYTLLARVDERPPSPEMRTVVDDWTPHATVRLRVPERAAIRGRVVDEYGAPVPGASVHARPAHLFQPGLDDFGPTTFARFGQASDESARDGRFELGPLNGAHNYIVFCRPDPTRPDRKVVVRDVPGNTSDLTLVASDDNLRRATWTGEVYNDLTGKVLRGDITLIIRLDEQVLPAGLTPDIDPGTFSIDSLAPGYDYRLRVDADGLDSFESPWWTAAISGRHDVIRLAPGGRLDVATDAEATVFIQRTDDPFGIDRMRGDNADALGRASFSGLVAGTYDVQVVLAERSRTTSVVVRADNTTSVVLSVKPVPR